MWKILLCTKKGTFGLVSQVFPLYEVHDAVLTTREVDESFLPLSSATKDDASCSSFSPFPSFCSNCDSHQYLLAIMGSLRAEGWTREIELGVFCIARRKVVVLNGFYGLIRNLFSAESATLPSTNITARFLRSNYHTSQHISCCTTPNLNLIF